LPGLEINFVSKRANQRTASLKRCSLIDPIDHRIPFQTPCPTAPLPANMKTSVMSGNELKNRSKIENNFRTCCDLPRSPTSTDCSE
jgi:hypothetical protein